MENRERGEIRAFREENGTHHISELSSKKQYEIGQRIVDLFYEAIDQYEQKQINVQEITVCGSFAHGDALEGISDLDIRIVTDQQVENGENINDYIKRGYDTQGELFGYVDTYCKPKHVSDQESVTIWTP